MFLSGVMTVFVLISQKLFIFFGTKYGPVLWETWIKILRNFKIELSGFKASQPVISPAELHLMRDSALHCRAIYLSSETCSLWIINRDRAFNSRLGLKHPNYMLYFVIRQENTNIRCLYLSDLSMVQTFLTGFNSVPFFLNSKKWNTEKASV